MGVAPVGSAAATSTPSSKSTRSTRSNINSENEQMYQLRELTDFIWQDYGHRLEATLGNFKNIDRAVVEAMMIHYVASCYPFVFSFNDFCRLINLQTSEGGDTTYLHPEVVKHTQSDLEHFELYKRDHIKYGAWRVQAEVAPFIVLHNDLWKSFAQTPRPYYYHLLLIFEVMSTVWLGKWYELSQHHDLDFAFLGKEHYQDDDYKRHLISHHDVLSEEIPSHIFWIMRSAYDTIGAGFVSWFNDQLEAARTDPVRYIDQRTKQIY